MLDATKNTDVHFLHNRLHNIILGATKTMVRNFQVFYHTRHCLFPEVTFNCATVFTQVSVDSTTGSQFSNVSGSDRLSFPQALLSYSASLT